MSEEKNEKTYFAEFSELNRYFFIIKNKHNLILPLPKDNKPDGSKVDNGNDDIDQEVLKALLHDYLTLPDFLDRDNEAFKIIEEEFEAIKEDEDAYYSSLTFKEILDKVYVNTIMPAENFYFRFTRDNQCPISNAAGGNYAYEIKCSATSYLFDREIDSNVTLVVHLKPRKMELKSLILLYYALVRFVIYDNEMHETYRRSCMGYVKENDFTGAVQKPNDISSKMLSELSRNKRSKLKILLHALHDDPCEDQDDQSPRKGKNNQSTQLQAEEWLLLIVLLTLIDVNPAIVEDAKAQKWCLLTEYETLILLIIDYYYENGDAHFLNVLDRLYNARCDYDLKTYVNDLIEKRIGKR